MKRILVHAVLLFLVFSPQSNAINFFKDESRVPRVTGDVRVTRVTGSETLMEIARREGFGYEVVANSNRQLDPWHPGSGAEVLLPGKTILPYGAKPGLHINLAELRLFHLIGQQDGNYVLKVYPLGIGREGSETPVGQFHIIVKKKSPQWLVPEGLRLQDPTFPQVMPPGPQNPLGDYWLGLSASGYGIHGTNRPFGVGRLVSAGCMRLYPQDIATLYDQVEIGTPVQISYQPIKAAIEGHNLLLEAHPDYKRRLADPFQYALDMISKTGWPGNIDYSKVRSIVEEQAGMPEIIGLLHD